MVLSAYEDTIRSVRNAMAVAQLLRADAEAKREQAIIDREVAITMRDAAWRVVAAQTAMRLPKRR